MNSTSELRVILDHEIDNNGTLVMSRSSCDELAARALACIAVAREIIAELDKGMSLEEIVSFMQREINLNALWPCEMNRNTLKAHSRIRKVSVVLRD